MAALGVHDSGAHVAGFAPSVIPLSGGASSSIPLSARSGSSNRRRRYYDYGRDGDRGSGSRTSRKIRRRRPGIFREGAAFDDDNDGVDDDDSYSEEELSTSGDDGDRDGDGCRRKPFARRGRASPEERRSSRRRADPGSGVGRRCGSASPKRPTTGGGSSRSSPRRSPPRVESRGRSRGRRVPESGDSSSDVVEENEDSYARRGGGRGRSVDRKTKRGSSR